MKNEHHDSDFNSFEKIQQYLKGELSEAETHQMEKQMLSNPFLQDAVEGWEQVEDSEKRTQLLNDINKEIPLQKGPTTQVIIWRSVTAIAATISLFLVVNSLFFQNNETNATQAFEQRAKEPAPEALAFQEPQKTTLNEAEPKNDDSSIQDESNLEKKEKIVSSTPVQDHFEDDEEIPTLSKEIAEVEELEEEVFEEIVLVDDIRTTPIKNARVRAKSVTDSVRVDWNQKKEAKNNPSGVRMSLVEEDAEPVEEPSVNALNAQQRKPSAPNPYQLYSLEKYQEAAPLLEEYLKKNNSDQVLLFLLSVSYLELEQDKKAIEKLSSIKKRSFKGFKPNRVISLIKESKQEEALQQLKKYILVNKELILKE